MTSEADYRFLFRGSALALGGRIRRPDLPIQSQAAALTGVSGGISRNRTTGAKFGDIVSYASADSEVQADYQDPAAAVKFTHGNHAQNRLPTRTTVRTSLTGVAIINADATTRRSLTCAKLSAQMVSTWPGSQGQTSFSGISAAVDGLKLDTFDVDVAFTPEMFADRDTRGKLEHAYESSDTFRRVYDRFFFRPAGKDIPSSQMPESGGLTYCTIVSRISWRGAPNPNARIEGHKIVFKDFGTIYFGELFVSEFSRRLTLMRVELGSPCGGSLDFAEVETDGHGYPPY